MSTHSTKIGLSALEAGWILQRPEGQIRGMLRRGDLTYVVEGRKVDPASVRALLDGAYARLLLDVVLVGEFEIPKPDYRYGPPAPLYLGVLGLAAETGFVLPEYEIVPVQDELTRKLGPELLGWPTAREASERSVR